MRIPMIGLIALGACSNPVNMTGTVSGSVTANGSPIPNASVRAMDKSTVTLPDGSYLLADVAGGQQTVRISDFYQVCTGAMSQAVTVPDGGSIEASFNLDCSGPGPWTALSTGRSTCAIGLGGSGWCWGDGSSGALGNGTSDDAMIPSPVTGGFSFIDLTNREAHSCAVAAGRAAYCWGLNERGQLGNGTHVQSATPERVSGTIEFTSVRGCGLDVAGNAHCWGDNSLGQLGNGTTDDSLIPVQVIGRLRFTQLAGGSSHNCGLARTGRVFCWGDNSRGQLGIGAVGGMFTLPEMAGGGREFVELASGTEFVCAREGGGAVWCWGRNQAGQLGNGNVAGSGRVALVGGGRSFAKIALGTRHACALVTVPGDAYCWGQADQGQLGNGSTTPATQVAPVPVAGGWRFKDIDAGDNHACGLRENGSLYCWGQNRRGEVGDGTTTRRDTPIRVVDPR